MVTQQMSFFINAFDKREILFSLYSYDKECTRNVILLQNIQYLGGKDFIRTIVKCKYQLLRCSGSVLSDLICRRYLDIIFFWNKHGCSVELYFDFSCMRSIQYIQNFSFTNVINMVEYLYFLKIPDIDLVCRFIGYIFFVEFP